MILVLIGKNIFALYGTFKDFIWIGAAAKK